MDLTAMTKEQLLEESLIDITFAIFEKSRNPISFNDLLHELQQLTGLSDSEMQSRLPQFYTDLNVDGRFMAMNDGRWSLREWYPVDQIEEETAPVVKTRKKKKKAVDDEDEEEIEEEDLDDVEFFEEDYEELGDEEEEDDEEDADPDEDEIDDPAEGLEIIPDDEIDIDEEEEEEEDEDEEEEEL